MSVRILFATFAVAFWEGFVWDLISCLDARCNQLMLQGLDIYTSGTKCKAVMLLPNTAAVSSYANAVLAVVPSADLVKTTSCVCLCLCAYRCSLSLSV